MDNCTTQYAGNGCIGTAVSEHTLPVTGFDFFPVLVAIVVIMLGIIASRMLFR